MNWTSPQDAANWIVDQLRTFYAQSGVLTDLLIRAGQALTIARQANDAPGIQAATQEQSTLRQLLTDQLGLEQRVTPFAQWAGVPTGLGFLPLIPIGLIVIAIPTALALWNHLQSIEVRKQTLDMIERGVLTAAQAANLQVPSTFEGLTKAAFGFGNLGLVISIGVGLWLYFTGRIERPFDRK